MKNQSIIITILIIVTFLMLNACVTSENESSEPKKDIIGEWQSIDKSHTLKLTSNGKMNSVIESKGGFFNETSADLVFTDDTHILGMWERNISIWSVHITGDKMTLKNEDGRKIKFTRLD